jgi:NH3-dependent NAD+ synthetase
MSSLTEVTLQLIYKKLDEILAAITQEKTLGQHDVFARKEKPITQSQFNAAMEKVMRLVNKSDAKKR